MGIFFSFGGEEELSSLIKKNYTKLLFHVYVYPISERKKLHKKTDKQNDCQNKNFFFLKSNKK